MGLHTNIALVFDFDDTLVPDSTTRLLDNHGIDTEQFWREDFARLVRAGYDPTLAYLNLILANVGDDRPLGLLTNEQLRNFGASLDDHFFDGLPVFFEEVKDLVSDYRDVHVEFYIISGGLLEVIRGSSIVQEHFTAAYGCELGEDEESGVLSTVKRAVTFTEKTRYLFEIIKGLDPEQTRKNAYLVNERVDDSRIAWENIIYVGDGLTDVPCFSLVDERGGMAYGIFDPAEEKSAKRAVQKLLGPRRVSNLQAPHYGKNDSLGRLLLTEVEIRCADATIRSKKVRL